MRTSEIKRETKETMIEMKLSLDGTGTGSIETGIGFFNHMLEGFSKHGFFDLDIRAEGDLHVDPHHTVEDVGIVLGRAIREAVGDKKGISRFGYFILPMDDALALCSLDLGGRAYFDFECEFETERVGAFETQLVREFFYAVCTNAEMNLHLKMLSGRNDHHKIEAMFKAFAKALDMAVSYDDRIKDVLSTKGTL